MTQSLNRQNLALDHAKAALVEIYDKNGRLDSIATDAANKEVFSESNIVKLPGGGIDPNATLAKLVVAKQTVIARIR